jgi:hypothetical protein
MLIERALAIPKSHSFLYLDGGFLGTNNKNGTRIPAKIPKNSPPGSTEKWETIVPCSRMGNLDDGKYAFPTTKMPVFQCFHLY